MKKFEIKNAHQGKWLVLHNEVPNLPASLTIKGFMMKNNKGLSNPTGDPKEVQLLQKMENGSGSIIRRK